VAAVGGTVQRNLVNTVDRNMPTTWDVAKKTNIKWSVPLGSKAYGGPVIAGGKIFIGTNNSQPRDPAVKGDKGIIMCFQESDGKFLWQAVHDKLPGGRVNDWPDEGICSSPFVEGDRLYYVCNRCEVICASVNGYEKGKTEPTHAAYTGKHDAGVLWRLDMIKQFDVYPHNLATCSPLVAGDTLFVITSNGVDWNHLKIPSPAAPSFLAINKKTGKHIWKDNSPSVRAIGTDNLKALVDAGKALMHGQWSNPVYAEADGRAQIIFPGGDGWIRSFNPANGELLWKFDCNPKDAFYVLGEKATRNDFVSTPVVADNKLYIGVGQDPEHKKGVGHLWCIDITRKPTNKDKDVSPATKPGKKKDDPPETILDPKDPANKDSALVWHYGGMAKPGAGRKWVFGRTLSTCAIHDGLVYEAEFHGWIHCLDAKTGEKYWDHNLGSDTWASPYWVDGKVYIGNEDGEMLIFEHGKKKKLLKTIEMGGLLRATPVACNGVLYVMPENPCKLYAIKTKD
jgi:outer membrane protein assembly factor BamB